MIASAVLTVDGSSIGWVSKKGWFDSDIVGFVSEEVVKSLGKGGGRKEEKKKSKIDVRNLEKF